MDDKLVSVIYGSLLHDIGKLTQRADKARSTHSKHGYEFLKKCFESEKANEELTQNELDILDCIKNHMAREMGNDLRDDSPAFITYIADNIAAGTDRRDSPDLDDDETNTYTNWKGRVQKDIFNVFKNNEEKYKDKKDRFYKKQTLDDDFTLNFPQENNEIEQDYRSLVENIKKFLKGSEFDQKHISSLYNILESHLSFIPSSTNGQETQDISLFDHLKLTSGIAACIYHYLKENNRNNYKKELFQNSENFYKENIFMFLSMNISGIQDFIYTIHTENASKTLRGRSFYLEMVSEFYTDLILERLGLSRCNALYVGGGQSYLILPNTNKAKETIEKLEKEINDWLLDTFNNSLFIAFGLKEFSANTLFTKQNREEHPYNDLYKKCSKQISEKKLSRYTKEQLLGLNKKGKVVGRECKICNSINDVDDKGNCSICNSLIEISRYVQSDPKDKNNGYFIVSNHENHEDKGKTVPIFKDKFLSFVGGYYSTFEKVLNAYNNGENIKIYSKNKFSSGFEQSTRLLVGEYTSRPKEGDWSFEKLAKNSTGIKRLGALRLDVDDLGQAFISGFPYEYATISRSSMLSKSLSLFFKYYINNVAKNPKEDTFQIKQIGEKDGRDIQIIYAGGDDVFAVGSWNDIINFGIDLQEDFNEWTNGKLTLSAGIGIFHPKYPISKIASWTGVLESSAKKVEGKNAVCLFEEKYKYSWDNLKTNVIPKYDKIKELINNTDEKGKSFLYNILALLRSEKAISTARFVYTLSKNSPKKTDPNYGKYMDWTQEMYKWMKYEKQELELAIILYIYTIRKE